MRDAVTRGFRIRRGASIAFKKQGYYRTTLKISANAVRDVVTFQVWMQCYIHSHMLRCHKKGTGIQALRNTNGLPFLLFHSFRATVSLIAITITRFHGR